MEKVFYLDDYNLISSNLNEKFLSGNISLLKNDKEIDFSLTQDETLIHLSFFDEYKQGDKYLVKHNNDEYIVYPRFIVHTKRFDEEYKCDVNILGSFYTKNKTTFRIWAPFNDEAYVVIDDNRYKMNYIYKGLYEINVKGDFDAKKYHYELFRNNNTYTARDPFSYASSNNSNDSYVIDLNKFKFKNIKANKTLDPIIYELSVRDFSSDRNVGFKNRSKFISFLEEGLKLNNEKVGIDYLKELGVTHIQLLPVLNYSLDGSDYNWGYNPVDYNSLYQGYVSGTSPYDSIIEFRSLVDKLHSIGLKVNLDVVFNHMYKYANEPFSNILPYYLYRFYPNGEYGNASYCGNEIRSEALMVKEYFKLINERLINLFDIDGLRFDLMGVMDLDTINYLYTSCLIFKNDFMFYGEGWNMGDILPIYRKSIIENSSRMKNIMFFNGIYRDVLRGPFNEKYTKGFLMGNKDLEARAREGLLGSYDVNLNKDQSINYIECHDNMTFYDKLSLFGYSKEDIKSICKLGFGIVLLSRGIPFIHAGQEFLRTKRGIDNTYNLSDDINKIDWSLVYTNKDSVEYFKTLVKFRKDNNIFRKDNKPYIYYYYDLPILTIENVDIFINNSEYPYIYDSDIEYKEIIFPNNKIQSGLKVFDIPKYSLVIAKKA